MLGLPEAAAEAIYALDEHWDGKGHPRGLAGDEIPLLARILCLAQTVEVFLAAARPRRRVPRGRRSAARRGSTRRVVCALLDDLRRQRVLGHGDARPTCASTSLSLAPAERRARRRRRADRPRRRGVRAGHRREVAVHLPPLRARRRDRRRRSPPSWASTRAALRDLRRAGLLHDIGKLGVSNLILDKPGPLTAAEVAEVRRHPALHASTSSRTVAVFGEIAAIAAAHHERLDGSGYHRGLTRRRALARRARARRRRRVRGADRRPAVPARDVRRRGAADVRREVGDEPLPGRGRRARALARPRGAAAAAAA